MPNGLLATYTDNIGNAVGDGNLAVVTFALDAAYKDNYVLPDSIDRNSYIDPDGNFLWSKSWTPLGRSTHNFEYLTTPALQRNI